MRDTMKITLDEESIDNIFKYMNKHPEEINKLMETYATKAIDILMKDEILEKGADLYKMIKRAIQKSQLVSMHKCPRCRSHPLKKVKGQLLCDECGWTGS